jgi:hypothetical protein
MSYTIDSVFPSQHIYLYSKDGIYPDNQTNVLFNFINSITCDKYHQMILTVEHFTFPIAYYNINSYNNTLSIEYNDGSIDNITIQEGNYSAKSLAEYLNDLGTLMTLIKYDDKTNKIYFVCDQSFQIVCNNDVFFICDEGYETSSDKYLFSSFVNLSSLSSLHIHCDTITTSNLSSREGGHTDVILKIPVDCSNNYFLDYRGDFGVKIFENKINHLHFRITDDDNNIINIPKNTHWTATIRISFVQKKEIVYRNVEDIKETKK